MKGVCSLCGVRKAKRTCPAVQQGICAVCCGTKRLTEIACPPECVYLKASRVHPPAIVQRQQQRDMQFLAPRIGDLTESQYRLLLFAQAIVQQHARNAMPPLVDMDVADAAATVAATLETASKGIIYEHRAASIPAQRLATELTRPIADLRQRAGAEVARVERDLAAALRRLERLAREAQGSVPEDGAEDRSWLALASRLLETAAAAERERPETSPEGDKPRIVL
jgi:hypothetical protein